MSAPLKQRHQIALDPPALTFRAASVFRRIQNDSVIASPAPDLAFDKAAGIFGDEADRGVFHAGGIPVLEGLGNGLPAGVHMGDLGAGLRGVKAGDTGIGEQVQDPWRPSMGGGKPVNA